MKYSFKILLFFTRLGLLITLGGILFFSGIYLYLEPQLSPDVYSLRQVELKTPLRIYSADNKLIAEFGEERRQPITYEQIPQDYLNALISTEDQSFYEHNGIVLKSLIRASIELALTGKKKSGGSTITMQVARNYLLSREKTFVRKIKEILLSLQIEHELSKQEIMELYVNIIFLGHRAYGIEAAANVYYGKHISELNTAQLAMLAGLPKAPSTLNPISYPTRALERRNLVLFRMFQNGHMDEETYERTKQEPITASYHTTETELSAPDIAEMVRLEMINRFGKNDTTTKGYKVFTTVLSRNQSVANLAVRKGLLDYDRRHGFRGVAQNYPSLPNETESIDQWLTILNNVKSLNDLSPGIVSKVEEQSVNILLKNGEIVTIHWDGLSWAKKHIDRNIVGEAPTKASNILKKGDLIYATTLFGTWSLAQLPEPESALISLKPDSGAIIALVGGANFETSGFNRITQARRQPGSNFKPFIYAAAFDNGYSPASVFNDAPLVYEDENLQKAWRPQNSNKKFAGPTRLRTALYTSRNLVSIRLLRALGISTGIDYATRFGFLSNELPQDLSLVLGSAPLKPIDIVTAYSVLANGGFKIEPYFIERIEDSDGNILFDSNPITVCHDCNEADITTAPTTAASEIEQTIDTTQKDDSTPTITTNQNSIFDSINIDEELQLAPRVIDKRTAYMITNILQDAIQRGTAKRAKVLKRQDIAGKTGTTNDQIDAWFSGYNADIVTTTWMGFDDPQTLGQWEYGSTAALPIWIDYMRTALYDTPERSQKQPEGIATVKIDPETGYKAYPGQPNAIFELFKVEDIPTKTAQNNEAPAYQLHDNSPRTQSEEASPETLF